MNRRELPSNEPQCVIHESLSEVELNELVSSIEASNTQHRAAIELNDSILSMAKRRIIGLQLAEAEVE